jgi:hypothetical protein
MSHSVRITVASLTLVVAASLLAAPPAAAQDEQGPTRSTIRGFSGGIGGSTTLFGRDGADDVEHTRRLWVTAGYGITDRVALHVSSSGERDGLWDSQLEARYTFGSRTARWRPHAGAGVVSLTTDRAVTSAGGRDRSRVTVRPLLAGGISYYLRRGLSLDGSVRHTFSEPRDLRCDEIGERAACRPSTRLYVGMSWYPWAR